MRVKPTDRLVVKSRCSVCDGSGVCDDFSCVACTGTGYWNDEETITVSELLEALTVMQKEKVETKAKYHE